MLLAGDAATSGSPGSLRELSIEPGDGCEQLKPAGARTRIGARVSGERFMLRFGNRGTIIPRIL